MMNLMCIAGNDERSQFVSREMKNVRKNSGILSFKNCNTPVDQKKIKLIQSIGCGAFGEVSKKLYDGNRTKMLMAVKLMVFSPEQDTMYRSMMEIHVTGKLVDCPQIVKFYGYFLQEAGIQLCMEYMDTCLNSLIRKLKSGIPEYVIGSVSSSVIKALNYLKTEHNIIHRDVKPNNILLDGNGNSKLCDFGISQKLVNSVVYSNVGCQPYMPPERLSTVGRQYYGVESDIWSLGITMVELANGKHPYIGEKRDPCEELVRVLDCDAPRLSMEHGFSQEFCDIVEQCLQKEPELRSRYQQLLQHPFVQHHENNSTKVKEWVNGILIKPEST